MSGPFIANASSWFNLPAARDMVDLWKGQQSTVPAPAQCPTKYRLKTTDELGEVSTTLDQYGGQVADSWGPFRYSDGIVLYFGLESVVVPTAWCVTVTAHQFTNNGTQRSHCNHCGVLGRWDWRLGDYTE